MNIHGKLLLIVGFLALASACSGSAKAPGGRAGRFELHDQQLQWAGYGALLAAVGLILIWQGKR